MAIIKDYITPNGVHVRVHDDLAAKPGTPEAAAVIRGACRVAKQILMDMIQEDAKDGTEAEAGAPRKPEAGARGQGDRDLSGGV